MISSIADLPFDEQDPLTLLGFDVHGERTDPDMDFYGFGYARVDELWLTCEGDPEPLPPVRDALLLALHVAPHDEEEDDEPLADDVLLEFWIDEPDGEGNDDYALTALLSRFLELWLPRVSSDESAIVLALCNPHGAVIARPSLPGGQPIYYATGDVISWLDEPEDPAAPAVLRLTADAWHRA